MTGLDIVNPDREMAWLRRECEQIAKSSLVPASLAGKPEDLMLIALEGHALGLQSTVHAMKHIYVMDGRTVLSAQLRTSLASAAGHEFWSEQTEDSVTVKGHRRGKPNQVTSVTFSMADARRAGLLDVWWEKWVDGANGRKGYFVKWVEGEGDRPDWVGKPGAKRKRRDNWFSYPMDMCHARAMCRWVSRVCPEVLLSLSNLDDTPLEEIDRAAFAEPPAPGRQSFIDVDEVDDPVDAELIRPRMDWPTEWRLQFGPRWDRTVSAALISYATNGRVDMAGQVYEAEQDACEQARQLWLDDDIEIVNGKVVEP